MGADYSLRGHCACDSYEVRLITKVTLSDVIYSDGRAVLIQAKVLLEPGDLLLLHGDARYKWAHGIEECTSDQWGESSLIPLLLIEHLGMSW
jgi:hypothetical protein